MGPWLAVLPPVLRLLPSQKLTPQRTYKIPQDIPKQQRAADSGAGGTQLSHALMVLQRRADPGHTRSLDQPGNGAYDRHCTASAQGPLFCPPISHGTSKHTHDPRLKQPPICANLHLHGRIFTAAIKEKQRATFVWRNPGAAAAAHPGNKNRFRNLPMETKHENENESRQGNGLPMRYLRLLAPPLQLLSATMWQVVQQGLVQHYGMLEEFVSMVTELVPELMSYNQRAQLVLGLRARLVLELCRGEEPLDINDIQNRLDRIKTPGNGKDLPENPDRVEESQVKFVELVQALLKDSSKRNHFFQEIFPDFYGPKFDTALEMLIWEFITRLEELLPSPDFTQVAALLGDAPCLLENCLQSFFSPEDMKAVVEHHRNLGFFEEKGSRHLPMDDCILSALSFPSAAKRAPDAALLELTPNSEPDHSSRDLSPCPGKTKSVDSANLTSSLDTDDVSESSQATGGRVLRKRKTTIDYKDIPRKQPTKALPQRNSSADEDNSSDSPLISYGAITQTALNRLQLKNRQLLGHISRKLFERGYRRTPEQCKSRIKRLRKYFTQISSSVTGKTECRFYDQLERILRADPDSTCEDGDEEESQDIDDDMQFIEQNLPLDTSTDTVSSSARAAWSDSETLALINIWGENKDQAGSRGGHRGAQLFNIVSKKMAALGYFRTPDQCQTRMKRLKARFRQSYDNNCGGGGQDRVFSELARFMPRDHSLEDEVDRALEELQDDDLSAYFNQDLDAVFNLQEERKKVTWSDKETVLLLEIWGDPQVQHDLKRIPHNSPVYNEIAEKLAACGYRRSADQCYTRIKRLKALYRNCLEKLDKGGDKSDFKFYNILDKILGSQPSTSSTPSTPSAKAVDPIEISEDSNSNSVPEIDGMSFSRWANGRMWRENDISGLRQNYDQCCLKVKELRNNFQQCHERKKAGKAVEYRFYDQLEPILGPLIEDEEAEKAGDSVSSVWKEPETIAFLQIWAANDIQQNLKSSFRTGRVYSEISAKLATLGYYKSAEQCHDHITKLKKNYRRYCRGGSRRTAFPYLHIMAPVLGGFGADTDAAVYDSNQDAFMDKDQDASFHQPAAVRPVQEGHVVRPGDQAAAEDLGEDRIQHTLKGSLKNRHVYNHISTTLRKYGLNRSADQCYTRIKRLKAGYHHEKSDFRYYKELEEIFQKQPKADSVLEMCLCRS
ncbi:hypothetical protein WMY93_010566 [Mugilogobius chulae]|uniref:Myb-like domain-containing protein n=1 Tax=Mugilogobius chulae TaxID=88201 RepID=A0AAW0P7M0_9GOBI